MDATELYNSVLVKIDELKNIEEESKTKANILSVLNKEYDEVTMCKVLWWILDQNVDGRRIYLEAFSKDVLKMNMDELQCVKSSVYREYCIPGSSRRIDIVIQNEKSFIPIEAKIYADDQENQCADYLEYASSYYSNPSDVVLFYLTLNKEKVPSGYSISYNESYRDRIKIITWFEVLDALQSVRCNNDSVSEIVSQYCKGLEVLLNLKKEGFNVSVDTLIDSPDGIKAAIEIEKALDRKKRSLMHDIYEAIIEKTKCNSEFDYDPKLNEPWDYKEGIEKYYSKKGSTYPGVTYNIGLLDKQDNNEYYLILRFEIDYKAFVGLSIMKRNEKGELSQMDNPSDELVSKAKDMLKDSSGVKKNKDWWLCWSYIISKDQDKTNASNPDFKEMNEAYFSLFDEETRKAFVNEAVEVLKKYLNNVK